MGRNICLQVPAILGIWFIFLIWTPTCLIFALWSLCMSELGCTHDMDYGSGLTDNEYSRQLDTLGALSVIRLNMARRVFEGW